jgi:hypothetical protein
MSEELQGEGGGTTLASLKEVFADPLLSGELPGDQEVIEIAEAAPNASAAIFKLHRAYREQAERLSDLSSMLAREGHSPVLVRARGCRWTRSAKFWKTAQPSSGAGRGGGGVSPHCSSPAMI